MSGLADLTLTLPYNDLTAARELFARAGEEIGVNLAVSLHAVTKEIRDEIVPMPLGVIEPFEPGQGLLNLAYEEILREAGWSEPTWQLTTVEDPGAGMAEALARAGAAVVIGDIREELGEATVDAIKKTGGDAAFLPLNVTDDAAARPRHRDRGQQSVARAGRDPGPEPRRLLVHAGRRHLLADADRVLDRADVGAAVADQAVPPHPQQRRPAVFGVVHALLEITRVVVRNSPVDRSRC